MRLEPAPGVALVGGTPLPGVLAGSCAEAEWFHPCLTLSGMALYAPQNVQDGYLRPWNGPRVWASEGLGTAGEALYLRWKKPVQLESVLLFFRSRAVHGTDQQPLRNLGPAPSLCGRGRACRLSWRAAIGW